MLTSHHPIPILLIKTFLITYVCSLRSCCRGQTGCETSCPDSRSPSLPTCSGIDRQTDTISLVIVLFFPPQSECGCVRVKQRCVLLARFGVINFHVCPLS